MTRFDAIVRARDTAKAKGKIMFVVHDSSQGEPDRYGYYPTDAYGLDNYYNSCNVLFSFTD